MSSQAEQGTVAFSVMGMRSISMFAGYELLFC
jgi:hypothetical protein